MEPPVSPKTPPDGADATVVVLEIVLRVVAVADAKTAGFAVDGLDAGAGADPDEPEEPPEEPPVEPLDGAAAALQLVGGAGLNPEPV